MKTKYLPQVLALFLAAPFAHAGFGTHGGLGVVCFQDEASFNLDEKLTSEFDSLYNENMNLSFKNKEKFNEVKVLTTTTLDLMEGEFLYGLKMGRSTLPAMTQVNQVMEQLRQIKGGEKIAAALDARIKLIQKNIVWDYPLPRLPDETLLLPKYIGKNCAIRQIAIFSNTKNEITLNPIYVNKVDDQSLMTLLLHEGSFKLYSEANQGERSSIVREITANFISTVYTDSLSLNLIHKKIEKDYFPYLRVSKEDQTARSNMTSYINKMRSLDGSFIYVSGPVQFTFESDEEESCDAKLEIEEYSMKTRSSKLFFTKNETKLKFDDDDWSQRYTLPPSSSAIIKATIECGRVTLSEGGKNLLEINGSEYSEDPEVVRTFAITNIQSLMKAQK